MIKKLLSNIVITILSCAISITSFAGKEIFLCTGFFINSIGTIVTAKHCVENGGKFTVVVPGQDHLFQGTVLNNNFQADVGLLSIPLTHTAYFKLQLSLKQGQRIATIGLPSPELLGFNIKEEYGYVYKILSNSQSEIEFVLVSHHGGSGSPIVDANGSVIAVLVAGYDTPNVSGTIQTVGVSSNAVNSLLLINGLLPSIDMMTTEEPFDPYNLLDESRPKVVLIVEEVTTK